MSMINELFYSNVRAIKEDLDLVEDLKEHLADHLQESVDKTQKIFLYVKVKFHGFYAHEQGCVKEIKEGGELIINMTDGYKIMRVIEPVRVFYGKCNHGNSKKELVIGDLDIKIYHYKESKKDYRFEDCLLQVHYERRDPITISRKPA